jgi:hypothetical protein
MLQLSFMFTKQFGHQHLSKYIVMFFHTVANTASLPFNKDFF